MRLGRVAAPEPAKPARSGRDGASSANGKKTSESHPQTDFNGGGWTPVRTYAYDALGRLTQATAPTDVVGHNATRTTTYTSTGKVASTVDEIGRVTSYTYDERDRLVPTTRPDGTVETQTYDAEGQRTSAVPHT